MKQLLRLGFTDTMEVVADFFIDVLKEDYNIVRDDQNPDYLIFGDTNFGSNNLNYTNCFKIFYTGENQRPWDYKCHFAISFDHDDTPNNYRLPLYVVYDYDNKRRGSPRLETRNPGKNLYDFLTSDKGFCSFVVKNGGCEIRNRFFHKLCEYKKVDSAGPLFNNTGITLSHDGHDAIWSKMEFIAKYKFNMCFENASYPGYATEKLYEALVGDTVPIYWGSPTIALDFNPKAFLNWHDYQDDDLFIEAIKKVDQDDKLYSYMLNQPMLADGNKVFDMDRFRRWWSKNVYKGAR